LDALQEQYPDLPIIGVVQPGAQAAVAASLSQRIAVIATEGTIDGGAYQNALRRLNPAALVTARACSLFVAMAEEGWTEGPIAEAVARRYLQPLFDVAQPPDTLVLGCTHFPVLAGAIRAVLPPGVTVVDSAATTTTAVVRQLRLVDAQTVATDVASASPARGAVTWLATDGAARFARVGTTFFGEPLAADAIAIVDL
jgi:glutamate racemase